MQARGQRRHKHRRVITAGTAHRKLTAADTATKAAGEVKKAVGVARRRIHGRRLEKATGNGAKARRRIVTGIREKVVVKLAVRMNVGIGVAVVTKMMKNAAAGIKNAARKKKERKAQPRVVKRQQKARMASVEDIGTEIERVREAKGVSDIAIESVMETADEKGSAEETANGIAMAGCASTASALSIRFTLQVQIINRSHDFDQSQI